MRAFSLYRNVDGKLVYKSSIRNCSENRRSRGKIVILESSFSSRTFLLVESPRAFSQRVRHVSFTMWRTFFIGTSPSSYSSFQEWQSLDAAFKILFYNLLTEQQRR